VSPWDSAKRSDALESQQDTASILRENHKWFNKGTNAPRGSDEEAQPFQRRSSHSISWQVFAAQSRSSA